MQIVCYRIVLLIKGAPISTYQYLAHAHSHITPAVEFRLYVEEGTIDAY